MLTKTKRWAALLLTLVWSASGLLQAQAAEPAPKKVYEVVYASENLSTPANWVSSPYFNNPQYKETRFEDYNTGLPIAPGGTRETSFYMAYRDDGLYVFFQSNEPDTDADGLPKESWLELYLATGEGDIPYHQMIVPTKIDPIEYYEWQTEYRDNRPLQGGVTVNTERIPGGWGTVVVVPWEVVYDSVPLDGGNWQFNLIRWSPVDGQTWGGQVHQTGRFNLLHFQPPTVEQRMAIQKELLTKAWSKFQATSAALTDYWVNRPATADSAFYNRVVQPLIASGTAAGAQMPNLGSLNAQETESLYQNVSSWMELRYDVDDQRLLWLKNGLMRTNRPPTVTDATYVTKVNTSVSGVVYGTDEDGDALTYTLGVSPEHGTVTVNENGHWTYTPAEHYTGHDRFTVVVSDSRGGTATATVDLTVTAGPVTTAVLSPQSPNGSNGWYTSDVTVTLATYSDGSGAARTEYRIDGGSWNAYNGTPLTLGEGRHLLEYRGIDPSGIEEAVKSVAVNIDKTPPQLTVRLNQTELWPANHKMVPIQATLEPYDGMSGIASVVLTSITSSEAGDDTTAADIEGADYGTADTSFSLRAERSGDGNGRTYTITYTVTDQAGLSSAATATVTVPHNQ